MEQGKTRIIRKPNMISAVGVYGVIETNHAYNDDLLRFYAGVYRRDTKRGKVELGNTIRKTRMEL